jgi:hypothetical protein
MDSWGWEHLTAWLEVRFHHAGRGAALRYQRADRGSPSVSNGGPHELAAPRVARLRTAALRAAPTSPRARRRDERNATLNYRSVLARELTAKDARLYGRVRRPRRSRRSTTDD